MKEQTHIVEKLRRHEESVIEDCSLRTEVWSSSPRIISSRQHCACLSL